MKERKKAAAAWALCAAWMGVIFLMSAMPGEASGETSGRLVKLLMLLLSPFVQELSVPVELVHLLVRKAAHMAEYAVLFLLARRAFSLSGAKHPCAAAFLLSLGYAATDEWHQSFVDSRGPSAADVMIDGIGAGIAWAGCAAYGWLARRRKKAAEEA